MTADAVARSQLTAVDLSILQHSLGVDKYGRGQQYRSHYVIGPDAKEFEVCQAMTVGGLMNDHGPSAMCGGMHIFQVTKAGRKYVAEHSPAPPKLTRSQRRYEEFLKADSGMSFGEWLRCK